MQQFVTYLLARFSEPSSYAGLGAVAALIGFHLSDSDIGGLAQFLAAGCALAALLLKERGTLSVLLLVAALAPALGACAPLTGAGSAFGAVAGGITVANQVSAAVDPVIATACNEYQKGRAAADAVVATGWCRRPSPPRWPRSKASEMPPAPARRRATQSRPRSGSAASPAFAA